MNKILITGAGGFIGSHLAEKLILKGYNIKAFLHYNSSNDWGWLEYSDLKNDMEIVTGDIRDYDSVYNALKDCSSALHLAALIGIPYSYVSPLAYIKTNVEGTYNILQASKELDIEKIVVTSTSEVYGTAQYEPIDENHPMIGQSPYSASKIASDQLAISYFRSYGLPVKIARPFNTFGPRQSGRAIIPTIIIQILSGRNELKIGNLFPKRDFIYVQDTCEGFLEIFKSGKLFGEITNIGIGNEISISDLVKIISQLMGIEIKLSVEEKRIRNVESEVGKLICDNTKILKSTGWRPQFDLREGLNQTINWIRQNLKIFKSDIYNV